MNVSVEHFNEIFKIWIDDLHLYNYDQLTSKPNPEYWSIGQLYMHIINETRYFFDQSRICMSNNDNENEAATAEAKTMFRNNAFPDERIQGDPSHVNLPQPVSKEQLKSDLIDLKVEMNRLVPMISERSHTGKTQHPGLNYFCASEWIQFAEMHFRHHEIQKQRINAFIKTGVF
jgi:DinB superfamily